ncbi:putative signal peptide protein [Puccinia sorghi]|uniref:Putative signal peptide protein n=1 Tax=Puccinia sorghi TaxID=27349 RepID=A0A0L6UN51_9BASI|nr:putative signal peptide protein [Puccinia sorghi]
MLRLCGVLPICYFSFYVTLCDISAGTYLDQHLTFSFLPSLQNKLAQLPAVDMQHAPAKLSSKLHPFACVDFLAQSICIWSSNRSFHVNCRQLSKFFSQCFSSIVTQLPIHFVHLAPWGSAQMCCSYLSINPCCLVGGQIIGRGTITWWRERGVFRIVVILFNSIEDIFDELTVIWGCIFISVLFDCRPCGLFQSLNLLIIIQCGKGHCCINEPIQFNPKFFEFVVPVNRVWLWLVVIVSSILLAVQGPPKSVFLHDFVVFEVIFLFNLFFFFCFNLFFFQLFFLSNLDYYLFYISDPFLNFFLLMYVHLQKWWHWTPVLSFDQGPCCIHLFSSNFCNATSLSSTMQDYIPVNYLLFLTERRFVVEIVKGTPPGQDVGLTGSFTIRLFPISKLKPFINS